MTPSPSTAHQEVATQLTAGIYNALETARRKPGGDCRVFAAPTDVFLDSGVPCPDLLVVCDPGPSGGRYEEKARIDWGAPVRPLGGSLGIRLGEALNG